MKSSEIFDVIIVGGGPAGLSAALVLGRCTRKVLVIDAGKPRNACSEKLKSFFTRDGIPPADLLKIGREDLERYPNVIFLEGIAVDAKKIEKDFEVTLLNGAKFKSRKLLLASGLVDDVPKINRIDEFYGKSVFICPYCDGWEQQDKPLAVYGKGKRGFEMARAMSTWSKDLILFTDGESELAPLQKTKLEQNGIQIIEEPIESLEGENGRLDSVLLKNGKRYPRVALFFDTPSYQKSRLAQSLNCEFTEEGGVLAKKHQVTCVKGLYVAGNTTKGVILAIVAAAEGAKAAVGINSALTKEDFEEKCKVESSEELQGKLSA